MYYSYFCVFGIHFRKNIAAFSHFNLRIWNVCVLWRSSSSSGGKKIIPERKIKFLLELRANPIFSGFISILHKECCTTNRKWFASLRAQISLSICKPFSVATILANTNKTIYFKRIFLCNKASFNAIFHTN